MDHREVGRYWNENADAWTQLAREGYDIYRDLLNTPAFFAMLPDVDGLRVIDVGCGEGHNTRLLATRGARVTAIDIADRFVAHAREVESREPAGIDYVVGSAIDLPFENETFDAAIATMSFMDIPKTEVVVTEAFRVLRPDGFLQFSITHPCFATPRWKSVYDENHRKVAVEVGDYFRHLDGDIEEWIFSSAPADVRAGLPLFRVPRFTRTLSAWINLLLDTGFTIERLGEPYPSDDAIRANPRLARARVVADFLHVRVRKPGITSPASRE